jgi:phosphoribosylformylglycinamidine synthase
VQIPRTSHFWRAVALFLPRSHYHVSHAGRRGVAAFRNRQYLKRIMKARVTVTLKTGILDPQGKAIEGALKSLGIDGIASVRQGKVFEIELDGADKARIETALKDAAEKLLANTVIENYRVELLA